MFVFCVVVVFFVCVCVHCGHYARLYRVAFFFILAFCFLVWTKADAGQARGKHIILQTM